LHLYGFHLARMAWFLMNFEEISAKSLTLWVTVWS